MKALVILAALCFSSALLLAAPETRIAAKERVSLDQIVIPMVWFDDYDLEECLDFAWARAIELDTLEMEPKLKGISIVIRGTSPEKDWKGRKLPEDLKDVRIQYHAKAVTLTKLLQEVAKQAKLNLYTTSIGVVFCRPGNSPFPHNIEPKGQVWETLFKHPEQQTNQANKPAQTDGDKPSK